VRHHMSDLAQAATERLGPEFVELRTVKLMLLFVAHKAHAGFAGHGVPDDAGRIDRTPQPCTMAHTVRRDQVALLDPDRRACSGPRWFAAKEPGALYFQMGLDAFGVAIGALLAIVLVRASTHLRTLMRLAATGVVRTVR